MKVTVGIPVFNDEENILRCLDSVLSQSYSDLEIIVSDNGSTDSTLEKIKSRSKDPRLIILLENSNRGANYNYIKVLTHATSSRFMFLGSDDYLDKNAVESLVKFTKSKDKYTVGVPNFHMYFVDEPEIIINKISLGMEKTGKITSIVRRVFSDEKLNYTFLGFYDTKILRKLLIKLPLIKSADRWMNLGGLTLGVNYHNVTDATYFRGIKKDLFVIKNKTDPLALSIINNSMVADLKNLSLIRNYLGNLGSKTLRKKIQIEFFVLQYILYCVRKQLKILLRPIIMKLPFALRSIVLRDPAK
jgi:glycosyltransferase involved in cell wall biosynthesis